MMTIDEIFARLSAWALWAVAWAKAHPTETGLLATAVVNTALRHKTPEEWIALAERRPVLAFVLGLVRDLGVDPVSALRRGQTVLNAIALTSASSALRRLLGDAPPSDNGPPTPRSKGDGR